MQKRICVLSFVALAIVSGCGGQASSPVVQGKDVGTGGGAASVYMGAPAKTVTAPNGALMSEGLAKGQGAAQLSKVVTVAPGLWDLRNFSIVNCIIAETPQGLVVFDTGTSVGQGETFLAEIRKLSNKPIIAIVYSHFHYTRGASAIAKGAGAKSVMIVGHPKLESNLAARSLQLDPIASRRANMQFGAYLPTSGPDAGLAPPAAKIDDPAKLANGHVKVTRIVADGEKLSIGGMEFQFFHAQGDTDDTLTVWIPEMSAVVTNVTSQQYFALYTLRGDWSCLTGVVIVSMTTTLLRHEKRTVDPPHIQRAGSGC